MLPTQDLPASSPAAAFAEEFVSDTSENLAEILVRRFVHIMSKNGVLEHLQVMPRQEMREGSGLYELVAVLAVHHVLDLLVRQFTAHAVESLRRANAERTVCRRAF